ncbi:MAG TPA: PDZ domain-containing protein [Planctomycetes bacterium]|nr:PDZ domain-containing protein [Planctomycetota bacterium]
MRRLAVLCFVSAVAGGLCAAWLNGRLETARQGMAQDAPAWREGRPAGATATSGTDEFTPEELVNIAVYEKCNRAVVNINTRSIRTDGFFLFEVPAEGAGSGVVLDRGGHVLTNFHVVEGTREVQVTLFNGKSYEARFVGVDEVSDVAVLRIDAPVGELYPISLGDSSRLRVGQRVYAIGNPFGLERTMTTGIISSLDRKIPSRRPHRTIKQVIQLDAAINPGNSGGPLLDSRGRMIGLNTAIYSEIGESAGVGFAIPVNTIARIVPQLIATGHVVRPEIGIESVYQTERGLLISSLTPGGPAERAGLRGPQVIRRRRREGPFVYEYRTIDRAAADLIVAVDDQPVRTADDLLTAIEAHQPGDQVVLTIIREGRQMKVPVTLEASQ